jgi:uncharacterized SAM-binding protein YcdF (DUF218 family)
MDFSNREKTYIVTGMDAAEKIPVEVKKRARARRWAKLALAMAATVAALGVAGFLFFTTLIDDEPELGVRSADAIVVLTGGEARIPEAIKLLSQGKGRRLLISGVNPTTTRRELASFNPNTKKWFGCCIDVGHDARDTIGNADETRAWVESRGFKSIIVVTASYHMPRSLAELRRALPDAELVAYPVRPPNLHVEEWWSRAGTLRFLAVEYVKFVPAFGRCLVIQIGRKRGVYNGARQCLNAATPA